ncbi:hypothetical protein [Aquabacterium sp.]|uniref:hypothetical protein n=1 Tax=Aquabacterium sp. TaxID=1872578 RepID=UPI003784CF59
MSTATTRFALPRRRLLALAGASLALAACAGTAVASFPPQLATLEVYDRDSGQVAPIYQQDGRQFVPGRPGARYALRLRNLSAGRVLVVLSVDGINVVSGETADWRQVGYVLEPGRSYDINGWRKSGTEIAAFEFAPIERSYAALTGRPGNVGVIGMAVFRERHVPPPMPSPPTSPMVPPPTVGRLEQRDAAPAAPSARAAEPAGAMAERSASAKSADQDSAAGNRLGTGHGQREWSVSRRTNFERATSTPEQVVQLEYDSHERLVAAGIIPAQYPPYAATRPRPFPQNQGYVPDPPAR